MAAEHLRKGPNKGRPFCKIKKMGSQELSSRRPAKKAEVELAYAIGVAKPVSIAVDTFGT